jgi:uncharacterized protein (TIGR00730 family)
MDNVVVFCGSGAGNKDSYRETAYLVGATLAALDIKVIYGGAKIGLMGAVADGALNAGGQVIGVIPGFLKSKEVAHEGLTELITVDNMHERKLKMHELSDGVIALPGGWGTMEELFEMLTWGQLGLHTKPIGILNIDGYYDSLIALCDNMVYTGFLPSGVRSMLLTATTINALLSEMEAYEPEAIPKILTEPTT